MKQNPELDQHSITGQGWGTETVSYSTVTTRVSLHQFAIMRDYYDGILNTSLGYYSEKHPLNAPGVL